MAGEYMSRTASTMNPPGLTVMRALAAEEGSNEKRTGRTTSMNAPVTSRVRP